MSRRTSEAERFHRKKYVRKQYMARKHFRRNHPPVVKTIINLSFLKPRNEISQNCNYDYSDDNHIYQN
jgi:saccharopine dehydrogenase-like NADP-dependent oxidoreductase